MSSDAPVRPDLSIVCVTYQSGGIVVGALQSALASAASAGMSAELIVVDNASEDGTPDVVADAFPAARVIRNPANRGFGAANNQAFAAATGVAWLLLNPDATLDIDCAGRLATAMRAEPRLAAVGPSIRGAGEGGAESAGMLPGVRSLAGHFLLVNRLLPRGTGGAWRGFQVRSRPVAVDPVEWVSAAVVLARPSAMREVHGFDESIFLYGEDLDLCARLADAGWRIGLVPSAQAWHSIGGSQAFGSPRWLDGIPAFLERRGVPRWRVAVCMLVVAAGLALRSLPWRATRGDPLRPAHRARMRSGALRAIRLAFSPHRAARR